MRLATVVLTLLVASPLAADAQQRVVTSVDTALVQRILSAEDRRDSTEPALRDGLQSADALVRTIAWRATQRIRDPKFLARDSLPSPTPPHSWAEPAWRLRYRAVTANRTDCGALRSALGDSAWTVRLRAADLVTAACADSAIGATLRRWVDALPADVSSHAAGGVSWQAAAHALVGLARMSPDSARPRVARLGANREWHVRVYAARAAAALRDTARLRAAARDTNDNVKEAALDALSALAGHADDDVYLAALHASGAQAVRAAAAALVGSPRADVGDSANAAWARWRARDNDSERDARLALLAAAHQPPTTDQPAADRDPLPADAAALALGKTVLLRVTMSPASGGGSFVVRLRGDVAPIMAARVLDLARAHYYDGGNWHRVEADFVIQGGGPGTNEYVGYRRYFRDELGTLAHARGTVGMSTRGHDTGDAQWFVNLKDNPRLTADYTVFAEVVAGIDVVDRVLEGDVIASVREERQ